MTRIFPYCEKAWDIIQKVARVWVMVFFFVLGLIIPIIVLMSTRFTPKGNGDVSFLRLGEASPLGRLSTEIL
jgi:hypothetical protein